MTYLSKYMYMGSILTWNKATRSPEISRQTGSEANTTICFFIYIGYRFPLSLSTIVFLNKKIFSFLFPEFIFSRNVGDSIRCKQNITPPPPPEPPPHLICLRSNKGIEDYIGYIDSHCPYLLFGETASHLTRM